MKRSKAKTERERKDNDRRLKGKPGEEGGIDKENVGKRCGHKIKTKD